MEDCLTKPFMSQVTEQTGICIHWLAWEKWSSFGRVDDVDQEVVCYKELFIIIFYKFEYKGHNNQTLISTVRYNIQPYIHSTI